MKKNISINLQGIIFHIEEDGFEVLSRYLAEVKAHFANVRGHEDIVADIEGRIAELFSARLSPTQQVISLTDVEAMMAKMGRVRDFAGEADEDDAEETAEAGAYAAGQAFDANAPLGAAGAGTGAAAATEPRRLYRDMAHRKIAGVAAGIAQYFAVNPLWIRLGFIALAFVSPAVVRIMSDDHAHPRFNLNFGSWAIIGYIVLWIVLPKRYDAPAPNDALLSEGPLAGRKLYRDTDTGKIGGVSAGLAAYFRIDVTLVRVLLLAGLFAGGFTFILYIILWIALPAAKTVSEKMRMRGDAVTLEAFDSRVRNNAFADGTPTANRPVGAFVEEVGRGLRPLVDFVGSAIRIAAGVFLTIMGFSLLLVLATAAGVALGLIPSSENVVLGDTPVHVLLNGVPAWGVLAGFLAFGIPAFSLLIGGLNLLLRRSLISRSVNLSLLGLWLLSVVGLTMAVVHQNREFQYESEVEQVERFPGLTAPVVRLNARRVDRQHDQRVRVTLASADSGSTVEVLRTLSAKGASEDAARRNATTSIDYTMRTSGDSALVMDDHFSFLPNARFRDQQVSLSLRLPRNRTFRLNEGFAYLLDDNNYVDGRKPKNPEQHRYRLRGNKLECIGCTEEQLNEDYNRRDDNDDSDKDEVNINIDVDSDDESGNDETSNSGTSLNFGRVPSFSTDLNSYGSNRRSFEEQGFREVHVLGAYRVVVRQGSAFRIEAAGNETDLNNLRVERRGNALDIRSRRSGSLFGGWRENNSKVLVLVEMPSLQGVELAGAVRADVSGFKETGRFKVEQAGASHLRLDGEFDKLEMDLAGACRTLASGRADVLDLDGAGACELAAANLVARRADVDLAGISKARLNVRETLKADAVGACVIEYSGNPKNVDTDATGASRVKRVKG